MKLQVHVSVVVRESKKKAEEFSNLIAETVDLEGVVEYRRYDRSGLLALTPLSLVPVITFYLDSLGLVLAAVNRYVAKQSARTPATITIWDSSVVPLSRFFDPLTG